MKPDRKKPSPNPKAGAAAARSGSVSSGGPSDEREPTAGKAPAPMWLIVVFGLLFYWSQIYLDSHGGGFHPQVYEKYASYDHVVAMNPKSGAQELIAKGESLFNLCGACHGASGQGGPLAPPLAESEWVLEPNPARLIRIPLHGLTGPIKVKGVDYNMSMAALGTALSDEDLSAILTYIRQAWGNKAPPVTPEQVKQIRDETSSRPIGTQPWTAAELQQVPVPSP